MIGTRLCIAVVGSKDYYDLTRVGTFIQAIKDTGKVVVSGGARGVDTEAADMARAHGMSCLVLNAEWEKQGLRAGHMRNLDMLEVADEVMAFWDGESRGTKHMISEARKLGLPVMVIGPNGGAME